jgi:TRAP-type C4-dicarboxylate transport system permease small subunit
MLLTVADVFLRYVFSSPIKGTSELASVLMTSLVLGVAWCAIKESHIVVDLVMCRFSPRVQAIVDSITLIAGLSIWIIFTWAAIVQSFWEKRVNAVVGITIDWPSYPFYWVYALGFAVLCLAVVALIVRKMKEAVKR